MKKEEMAALLFTADNDLAFDIVQWLGSLKITVSLAVNLQEALADLEEKEFQLAIVDFALDPAVTDSFLREIRHLRETKKKALEILGVSSCCQFLFPENLPLDPDIVISDKLNETNFTDAVRKALSLEESGEPRADLPLFNKEKVMSIIGNDSDILQIALETYIEDTPKTLQKLQESLEAGNCLEARRYSHSLEGASSTIGADALDDLLHVIHNHLRGEEQEEACKILPALRNTYARLITVLKEELNEPENQ